MSQPRRSFHSGKKSRGKQSEASKSISSMLSQMDSSDVREVVDRISDPAEACALIEAVPAEHPRIQALVLALTEKFPGKTVKKSARRLAFKLRNAGIRIEAVDADPEGGSLLKMERFRDELSAFMGPVMDLGGTRAVFFTSHSPVRGVHAGMGMVSPTTGMLEFAFGPLPKKLLGNMAQEIEAAAGPLVEVELSVFFRIMESALNAGSQGSPAALAYKEMRPLVQKGIQHSEEPLHGGLREESMRTEDRLTSPQAEELFSHAPLNLWIPADPTVASFMDQLKKVRESPLMLSNSLRKDREWDIRDKLAAEIFTPARRASIADILYETAYFYQKRGEGRLKALSLSAARAINEGEGGVSNPVIHLLISRVLESDPNQANATSESEEELDNGIIIAP